MKILTHDKDGGPESRVWSFWLIEWKKLLTVGLLSFRQGGREAFHSHAFNAVSWLLKGELHEYLMDGSIIVYRPSLRPIYTPRDRFHQVMSEGSLALTFRGPWAETWEEYIPATNTRQTLTHGRSVV